MKKRTSLGAHVHKKKKKERKKEKKTHFESGMHTFRFVCAGGAVFDYVKNERMKEPAFLCMKRKLFFTFDGRSPWTLG